MTKLKIGLVGYNCATGLGELNRQITEYVDVYRWLVKPHRKWRTEPLPNHTDCLVCQPDDTAKVEEFVVSVDIVLFTEIPYYRNLLEVCKALRRRVVCVPMMEWMPSKLDKWPKQVDLFICPTKYCYNQFKHLVPCKHFPWPVDTNKFKFQQRAVCKRFLFLNGSGGYKGRKGASVIHGALSKWPKMPILIRDQVHTNWGIPTLGRVANNCDLYSEGDVLISPHFTDGLGLEGMEAMACGMPVLSTDGEPWNEIPSLDKIRAVKTKMMITRPVDWYQPNAVHLVELCRKWLGQDISSQSIAAREWAETRSWDILAPQFDNLVRLGRL